jgi:hypothetical protein
VEDGFNAWCAPQEYAGTKAQDAQAPDYARLLVKKDDTLRVPIPAAYCVVAITFNQPVAAGASLAFFDGSNLFYKLPLTPASTNPSVAWAQASHDFVINPPYWEVTYRLAVLGVDGKELWTHDVTFAKPTPKACPFGGLPDPVTLACAVTDPWEIEPHPDATYPYDKKNLP